MKKAIGILAKLPAEMHYLVEPAMKYGVHQFDDDQFEFLQRTTSAELKELTSVAERYRSSEHHDLVGDFFDAYPITDYDESANLYFLFGLMNAAGLQLSPPNWNSVERHIKKLEKFGSYRLASERAMAARFLAEFGQVARAAIPRLRQAVHDEDVRVRVWAHYALAIIEGNRAEHAQAIHEIHEQYGHETDPDRYLKQGGLDASEALEKLGETRNADE